MYIDKCTYKQYVARWQAQEVGVKLLDITFSSSKPPNITHLTFDKVGSSTCFTLSQYLDLLVSGVLLGLGESQLLGVVLALVVGLCHRQRTEGGVTQLAVVILCGQDDPGGSFIQRLQDAKQC